MSIPWAHIIPVICNTIILAIGDRFLHTNLKWYRILIVVIFLELFAYFGLPYHVIVTSLSLLLILTVLLEVRIPKAIVLTILYAGLKLTINAWFAFKFFL